MIELNDHSGRSADLIQRSAIFGTSQQVILYFFHSQNLSGNGIDIRLVVMNVDNTLQADSIGNASDNQ